MRADAVVGHLCGNSEGDGLHMVSVTRSPTRIWSKLHLVAGFICICCPFRADDHVTERRFASTDLILSQ